MNRPPVNIKELISDLKFPGRPAANVLNSLDIELSAIALIETSIIIDGVEFKRTTPPSRPDHTD